MSNKTKKGRFWRGLLVLGCIGLLALFFINIYEITEANPYFLSEEEAAELEDVDCVLVLGCSVYADGTLCPMLQDRVDCGIRLYKMGASPKLLMSGDHRDDGYDEVNPMKHEAIAQGVPSEDVFMDHAGINTYNSMYRARDVFGAKKIIIVTQRYHLYRSVFYARKLGLDAYGVACEQVSYYGAFSRWGREVLARVKAFGYTIIQPSPEFLGDPIDLKGSGDLTNDSFS